MSHKKEQLAEEVQQKKEEAVSLKKELQEKRIELKEMGGGVLKGDEVDWSFFYLTNTCFTTL